MYKNLHEEQLHVIRSSSKGGVLFYTTLPTEQHEVFKIAGKGLYAWVNKSQFDLMKFDGRDTIKFGQYGSYAENGMTPQDTIASYSGTSVEAKVILWAHKFTEDELAIALPYDVEKIIQTKLGGIVEDGSSTEVFNTSVEEIKKCFSEVLYKTDTKESYGLRIRQKEAVDQMIKCYNEGIMDFLLGAIMRYGKNFTVLNAFKQIAKPGDVMLVLTNKPGVFESLEKDINCHIYFNNWNYIKLKDQKSKADLVLDSTKITVVAVSKQLADNLVSGDDTKAFLTNTKFKMTMFDECHSGTDTNNFNELLKLITADFKVWASGTAYRVNAVRGFDKANSYFYGYPEQQEDKKADIDPTAVTVECYIPAIHDSIRTNPNFNDEEQFSLTKLFATSREGKLIFGGEVRSFLADVLGTSMRKHRYSPYRVCEGNINHSVWMLPDNVKAIEQVAMIVKELLPNVGVIVATGNNAKEISEVHNAIRSNEQTITLTCKRFIEGTTVPEWTGIFIMSDTESVEKYFQFAFRGCTPMNGKDKAYMFDFAPDRALQMVFEIANAQAISNDDTEVSTYVRNWFDNYNVFRASEGPEFEKVQVEDVMTLISSGDYRAATLLKSYNKYLNFENVESVLNEFANGGETKIIIRTNVHTNGMDTGANYTAEGSSAEERESVVDMFKQAVENIASIIAALPSVSYLTDLKTVEQIASNCSDSLLLESTGVNKRLFNLLLDRKIINTRIINNYLI